MSSTKISFRIFLNIILYVVYVLFISIAFSFLFPIILTILDFPVLYEKDPIFAKVQIIFMFLVGFITFYFRKYFYLNIFGNIHKIKPRKKVREHVKEKKEKYYKEQESKKMKNIEKNENDIEILIGKEIK